jgi:hypothetical protein
LGWSNEGLKKQQPALYLPAATDVTTKGQLLCLLPGLQALCAEVKMLLDPVIHQAHTLHVRVPAALGVAHRVTDIVSKLWPLAATITLGHRITP